MKCKGQVERNQKIEPSDGYEKGSTERQIDNNAKTRERESKESRLKSKKALQMLRVEIKSRIFKIANIGRKICSPIKE